MAAPTKRIVVDGVDFGRLFRFPMVLRAATASLQPPRLVIGLLMVVTLMAFGRLWDGLSDARIDPAGLLAPAPTVETVRQRQAVLFNALQSQGVSHDWTPESKLDAREILAAVETSHRFRRATLEAGAAAAADERYRAVRRRILAVVPRGPFAASSETVVGSVGAMVQGVVYLRPQMIFEAGGDLFIRAPRELWRAAPAFSIFFGLLVLVVVAVGGGALCRMAACDFAGQERLRIRDAFDFALGNWVKLVFAPALPLLIAAAIAVVMVIFGVLLAPWIDYLGGLVYGLSVVLGFLLSFLLLGYAVGFPLLLPAVACENCDAVDAQQRAYAYVLNRPLHLVGYVVVALIGLALGYVVVAFVAATTLNLTADLSGVLGPSSVLLGAGGFELFDLAVRPPGDVLATGHESWAAGLITFWQRVVVDLVAAYVAVFVFTASTAVYLLMRRACDGQDVEDIWRPGLTPGTLVPLPRPRVERGVDSRGGEGRGGDSEGD